MSSLIHDCIVAFFFVCGMITAYLIVMWWINWFYKNFKIIKRDDENNGNNS